MEETGQAREAEDQVVDERGTSAAEGRNILRRLRDQGFEASDEKLALALGRPTAEVESWTRDDDGGGEEGPVDDDVVMKARGIAAQRSLDIG